MQRYKKSAKSKTEQFQNLRHPDRTGQKSAKSKTEQVKNLCPSVKSVGKKEKQQRKNLRHLRNLRDKKSPDYFRNRGFLIKEGGYLLSRIALQYHRRK